MSWDAEIADHEWNYTHNCNCMMATVLEEAGHKVEHHWLIGHMGGSWFDALNGMTGEDGTKLLTLIIDGLRDEPDRFREMEPENGWGSYDGVLGVLWGMLVSSMRNPHEQWTVTG